MTMTVTVICLMVICFSVLALQQADDLSTMYPISHPNNSWDRPQAHWIG